MQFLAKFTKISPRRVWGKISDSLNGIQGSWCNSKQITTQTFINHPLLDADIHKCGIDQW